jgi:osmotically-inducible protein OsmY
MNRPLIIATLLGLGLALGHCAKDQPPVVQAHQDQQGNTHIDINNSQIKKDLADASSRIQQGAKDLGQEVKSNATDLENSDTAIGARVKARLLSSPDLGGLHIHVTTTDGKVTLTGSVTSADRKADAEKIAARTDGVRSVNNQLEVAPNG